jgi:hypothetical protein
MFTGKTRWFSTDKKKKFLIGDLAKLVVGSLERLYETDYVWALIYAVAVNQVSCAVWAVDFVTFQGSLVAYATFLELGAAITIS